MEQQRTDCTGLVWYGLVCSSFVRSGLVYSCLVWSGLVWSVLVLSVNNPSNIRINSGSDSRGDSRVMAGVKAAAAEQQRSYIGLNGQV